MVTERTFEADGRFKLNGTTFEEATMDMLVLNSDNLEEHLMMQPAAIAYYGHMYKTAEQNYEDLKQVFELRWKEMYAECARTLSNNAKKTTINDVESLIHSTYKTEIEELNGRIRTAKRILDMTSQYYDAWKQKGFMIKSYADLIMTGYIAKDHVEAKDSTAAKLHQQLRES